MLSHSRPLNVSSVAVACSWATRVIVRARSRAWSAYGPLRVELHVAARCQGSGVDSGTFPGGARARRVRGALLLSNARPGGDRCRRQCAALGHREPDWALSALLERARRISGRALRHERDLEGRQRRPGRSERRTENPRQHQGRSDLRWARAQISDLGTAALSRASRTGHGDATCGAAFPGGGAESPRSTGMMAGRGAGQPGAAGGPARHIPVLAPQVVNFLHPRDGGLIVDGTFGAGGYTRAILAAANCRVIGIDRDQTAVAHGADLVESAGGRLTLVEDRFSALDRVARTLGVDAVDGVLLDVGVASMQLDAAARGFSFRLDGPLDMRMGRAGVSAADVVAHAPERDLAAIISTLGEERHARAVARAIVAARKDAPIETTRAFADIVARVVRSKPGDIHPATRTFQALRIFVNEELDE